jgi:hypothetical protein
VSLSSGGVCRGSGVRRGLRATDCSSLGPGEVRRFLDVGVLEDAASSFTTYKLTSETLRALFLEAVTACGRPITLIFPKMRGGLGEGHDAGGVEWLPAATVGFSGALIPNPLGPSDVSIARM